MTEIKPCPFCGDPMKIEHGTFGHVDQTEGCPIRQNAWGISALPAWNTRVPDPALLTGLREAREALRNILSDEEVALPRPDYEATRATLAHLDTLLAQEGQP